jgi:ferredoxin--NADP+ reductase
LAWLFLGVANSDALLYHDEFSKFKNDFPDNFRYDIALSREQKNASGGKMYVQDKIEEYSEELFKMLDEGAHIYFCGLRGMMPGIQETLKRVAESRGESWDAKLKQLKANKQWHVEVY